MLVVPIAVSALDSAATACGGRPVIAATIAGSAKDVPFATFKTSRRERRCCGPSCFLVFVVFSFSLSSSKDTTAGTSADKCANGNDAKGGENAEDCSSRGAITISIAEQYMVTKRGNGRKNPVSRIRTFVPTATARL